MKITSHKIVKVGEPDITLQYAQQTFKELLAFQGYGFCLGYDTEVEVKDIGKVPIGKLCGGEYIKAPALGIDYKWVKVTHIIPMGKKKVCEVTLNDKTKIICTRDHKFLCSDKQKHTITEIIRNNFSARPEEELWFYCEDEYKYMISCVDLDEEMPVMDITVDSDEHLFFANGIAASNCKAHATSYAVYSAVQLWLQEHYFLEYMATLMTHVDRAKEKKGVAMLDERVQYCIKHGVNIAYPDINRSGTRWQIINGAKLLAPLSNIKGFSNTDTETVEKNRPYVNVEDFLNKTKFGKGKFESLLFAGAFDQFGDVVVLYNWYYNTYMNKSKKVENEGCFDFGEEYRKKEDITNVTFTEDELLDKRYEMNGFLIDDNLLIKHKDIYDIGLKYFTKDDDRTKIYPIGEALIHESMDIWTIGKVRNVIKNEKFNSYEITIGDGVDTLKFRVYGNHYQSKYFQKYKTYVYPFYREIERDEEGKVIMLGDLKFSGSQKDRKDIFEVN